MSSKNNRIDFHNTLLNLMKYYDSQGYEKYLTENIYFQSPENIQIEYPAIVYSRYNIKNRSANNDVYLQGTYYQIVVLDKDPDSEIVNKISHFPTVKHSRHFTTSGLNHDVFIIYYK